MSAPFPAPRATRLRSEDHYDSALHHPIAMAGSTQELFDDEFTREVRDAYVRRRVHGVPADEATEAVLYEHRYSALMSPAHSALLWLALAVTQWQTGELLDVVRDRAIRFAEDDSWVRLRAASPHDDRWRRAVLASVHEDLISAPPPAPSIQIEPLYRAEPLDEPRRMKIASCLAALRAGNARIDFDAAPHVVVRSIARELDDVRATITLSEARRTATIVALGTLWGAQLARLGEWEWGVVVDAHGNRSRSLVRRDRSAFISPFLHASWYLDDPDANANVAESLFVSLRDEKFPRARSAGVLLSLRDYSYRLSDRKWPEERASLLHGTTHPATGTAPATVLADLDVGGLERLSDTSSCTINAPVPSLRDSAAPCPPPAPVVARRALVLRSLLDHTVAALPRDLLARYASGWSSTDRARYAPEAEALSRSRVHALRASGLWTHAEREEQTMLETPFTELEPPQLIAASWRAESLAALLWALGRLDALPPFDESANGDLLLSLTASNGGDGFILGAVLRPREEIERARTIAELWHWRSRTRQLAEDGRRFPGIPGFPVKSWDDVVRYTAPQAVTQGLLSHAVNDDFPAFGRAYRDLSADEWAHVRSIAMERHFALNWLCGYAPGNRWSETPTET